MSVFLYYFMPGMPSFSVKLFPVHLLFNVVEKIFSFGKWFKYLAKQRNVIKIQLATATNSYTGTQLLGYSGTQLLQYSGTGYTGVVWVHPDAFQTVFFFSLTAPLKTKVGQFVLVWTS